MQMYISLYNRHNHLSVCPTISPTGPRTPKPQLSRCLLSCKTSPTSAGLRSMRSSQEEKNEELLVRVASFGGWVMSRQKKCPLFRLYIGIYWISPPTQDASGKWRLRLGFPTKENVFKNPPGGILLFQVVFAEGREISQGGTFRNLGYIGMKICGSPVLGVGCSLFIGCILEYIGSNPQPRNSGK